MLTKPFSGPTGLPKQTKSLCPECRKRIDARIFEEDGKAMMEKTCPEHGTFKDVVWSDAEMYIEAERFARDGIGIENPRTKKENGCPGDCGLCPEHKSFTALANVDLTNRCNLRCPICFANANAAGYVFEPDLDTIVKMLENLRANKPVPTPAVQFSGGEPTVYPQFFEAIEAARDLGFVQIQVATNGILMAKREGFTQRMLDSGVHTVYLQFDGFKEENYIAARGVPLLDTKMKAIESCRNTKPKPLSTVLVPTVVKTINDDQVGQIVDFAVENRDVIRAVNFQPVAFTGRIDQEQREKERFTLTDLVHELVRQTDYLKKEDFFTVPSVVPISELTSAITKIPKPVFTPHPHCGIAAYLYVDDNGKPVPITQFIDVQGMFDQMWNLTKKANNPLVQFAIGLRTRKMDDKKKQESLAKNFHKYFGEYIDWDNAPKGFDIITLIGNMMAEGEKEQLSEIAWRTIMVGAMHFQDLYNYDIERVSRCCIHYAVPDGRIIPFCSYNGGPTYREEVEKKYSISLEEYKSKKGGQG